MRRPCAGTTSAVSQVGRRCDFIVLSAASRTELPYHFGVNLVGDVVVGGRVVVKDGAMVPGVVGPAPVAAFSRGSESPPGDSLS